MGIHPDLRGQLRLSYALGVVFAIVDAGVLLFLLFGEWDLAGIGPGLVLLYGAVMLFLGWMMLVWNPRHYRRATWVLENVPPERAQLTLREES